MDFDVNVKVDEDEGSLFHNRVNCFKAGKSKVQRKPSGYAITQVIPYRYIIFPSKRKTLHTNLASDCESKMQRMVKKLNGQNQASIKFEAFGFCHLS